MQKKELTIKHIIMKKEQKINLEEEMTVVEQKAESTPRAKKSGAWKSVIIGGVPGVLLGTAGTAFAQEVIDVNHQDEPNEDASNTNVEHIEPQEVGVGMAESVNDDMSFGEAFDAAREEVGPGGVFEWHGHLYNTYSAAEWESMSDEDRQEFANSVYNTQNEDNSEVEEQGQSPMELGANNVVEGNGEQEPAELTNSETTSEGEVSEEEVIDVQVHEVGSVTSEDGEILNVAVASVDGHDAAFVDVNNDGYVDGVLVDSNDDGIIEDNEVIETPDSDVDMSYLAMMTEGPEDSMYDGTPDYTNDADASSLA